MSVYVDSARIPYGRMLMSHMIADTSEELVAMAKAIGVNPKWIQHPGTHKEHFDVCDSRREKALELGAIAFSWKDYAAAIQARAPIETVEAAPMTYDQRAREIQLEQASKELKAAPTEAN